MAGKKELILEFSQYDLNCVVAGIDEIRRYNPQRFEMERLTAVVYEDLGQQIVVGYKDETPQDFWVRGHMPQFPLLPGVLMCESAAQLCSFFCGKHDLLGAETMGFGGLDQIKFRDPVLVGERLVIVLQLEKLRKGAMVVCRFQEFVREVLVCEGRIKGVPLPLEKLAAAQPSAGR